MTKLKPLCCITCKQQNYSRPAFSRDPGPPGSTLGLLGPISFGLFDNILVYFSFLIILYLIIRLNFI